MKYFATRISDNLHETPEGYILAIGVRIGRVGEMEYARGETPIEPGPDGIVHISRSAEELFKPETIASFEGKPLTIQHPTEFVNPNNWRNLAKGIMKNVRRGKGETADDLVCDILITDSHAISLVKNGLRQLSCGYEAEYVQTGEGTGEQKNIVGNHLALVEEGRAGDAYAIRDEKGVVRMNKKVAETLKALFGKTIDEAVAKEEKTSKSKSKDKKKAAKTGDNKMYDELVAMYKDLGEKIAKMGQPAGDEDKGEEESKDEEVAPSLEERLKALEEKVSKLVERESKEDEVEVGDEEEEEEVVIDSEEEEVADEEKEESEDAEGEFELTGDEKARIEILAPGLTPTKDFKSQALKAAYKTADGKKAIDTLTGGKPDFKNEGAVEMLFVASSELLKSGRVKDLARSKRTQDFQSAIFSGEEAVTAEKMNELNAKHYNRK